VLIIHRRTALVVPDDWESECQNKQSNNSKMIDIVITRGNLLFILFAGSNRKEIVIISIVAGVLVILILMLLVVFCSWLHRRHHRYQQMKDIQ